MSAPRTVSTRHRGDGSEPEFVVYENHEIIARFPVNDPASPDARLRAQEFATFPFLLLALENLLAAHEKGFDLPWGMVRTVLTAHPSLPCETCGGLPCMEGCAK